MFNLIGEAISVEEQCPNCSKKTQVSYGTMAADELVWHYDVVCGSCGCCVHGDAGGPLPLDLHDLFVAQNGYYYADLKGKKAEPKYLSALKRNTKLPLKDAITFAQMLKRLPRMRGLYYELMWLAYCLAGDFDFVLTPAAEVGPEVLRYTCLDSYDVVLACHGA